MLNSEIHVALESACSVVGVRGIGFNTFKQKEYVYIWWSETGEATSLLYICALENSMGMSNARSVYTAVCHHILKCEI